MAAAGVGAQHDVAELLLGGEAALGVDGDLEGGLAGRRRRADLAGGDLDVLFAQGVDHVARGHGARGELLRVEPDPHRIGPGAELLHVAARRRRGTAGPSRAAGRSSTGRGCRSGGPWRSGGRPRSGPARPWWWSPRPAAPPAAGATAPGRPGSAPAPGRLSALVPSAKVTVRVMTPSAADLGRLVEHPLDAVDRLLDGRGDGLGDHGRLGAGIAGAHHHRRRHHLRVLGDGQVRQGQQARDQDDERQHRGEAGRLMKKPEMFMISVHCGPHMMRAALKDQEAGSRVASSAVVIGLADGGRGHRIARASPSAGPTPPPCRRA